MPKKPITAEKQIKKATAVIHSSFFAFFLQKGVDRCAFITAWLRRQDVPFSVVPLSGKKHIVVCYPSRAYNPLFKIKTFIAHYDRDEHGEGANDNSAACIQLMLFAKQLLSYPDFHNIKIIFTDGEEVGGRGIAQQGAYFLGQGLRQLKMQGDDIFVFDVCGRGNILVLSRSGIVGRNKKVTQELDVFHKRCFKYAKEASPNKWISLLTPYSDNAGLIASGLTAQVVTVLPQDEATVLLKHMLSQDLDEKENKKTDKKEEINSLVLQKVIIKNALIAEDSVFAKIIPQTWQYMHTPADTIETLTAEAFVLIENFLQVLTKAKECY